MDWREEYRHRLTSPAEAVRVVRPGDRVVIPIGSNPLALADALAARADELTEVEVVHCAVQGDYAWLAPAVRTGFHVTHEHWASPLVRTQMLQHLHDYVPVPFSRRFKACEEERTAAEQRMPDVAFVQVSPPDTEGCVNLGNNVWNTRRYVDVVPRVLAEVSPRIPHCLGDTRIPVSRFTHIVESDSPPMIVGPPIVDAVRRRIAEHVVALLRDGDTLQVGAGVTSNAVVWSGLLAEREDLGWHSEASPAELVRLVRQGVITGRRKTLHPGVAVATSFPAAEEDLPHLDNNPQFALYAADYVHDPRTIAAHDNMVAINNALAVDLSGQVAAESVGAATLSGTGGQLEFAIGAIWSRGGRSIAVLPSTALVADPAGGRASAAASAAPRRPVSRIMSALPEGAVVSVPRLLADIVVTEHGVARLWGKSLRERAQELIAVAHPDFRADLRRERR